MSSCVVFVEDSDIDFEMSHRAVESLDPSVNVVRAQSVAEATNAIGQDSLRLVVLDINLGDSDGLDLLARLRKAGLRPEVGVVVFSTSCNPADRERSSRHGAHGYYEKPLSTPDYLRTVKEFVAPWVASPADPQRPKVLGSD